MDHARAHQGQLCQLAPRITLAAAFENQNRFMAILMEIQFAQHA